jgi:hypothetical protein
MEDKWYVRAGREPEGGRERDALSASQDLGHRRLVRPQARRHPPRPRPAPAPPRLVAPAGCAAAARRGASVSGASVSGAAAGQGLGPVGVEGVAAVAGGVHCGDRGM